MMIMRSCRMILALMVFAALGTALQSASAAQLSPEDMLTRLDGLETAYARKYISDQNLGFVTPVAADSATPDVMLITVLEFDTTESATAAFNGMMNGFVAKLILDEQDIDLTESTIDNLADQAILYTGISGHIDSPRHEALLAIQDGNLGFLITAYGGDDSTPEMLKEVATFMIEADTGTNGVIVDGLSVTGGTFDLMPAADDTDLLHGLIPMYEYDLLLNGGHEPLGHLPHPEATPVE